MNVEAREFDGIYTVRVVQGAGVTYISGTPVFLTNSIELPSVSVRAISAASNIVPLGPTGNNWYLNLCDSKNNILLENYPVVDLWDGYNPSGPSFDRRLNLRLFRLEDVDFHRSYLRSPFSTPPVNSYEVMRLSFFLK